MATRCARAKEGRLSLLELPETGPEDKKAKAKEMKRKGPVVLAAEPEMKRGCNHPESSKGSRPFYIFHNVHSHNTNGCLELRAIWDERLDAIPSATTMAMAVEEAEVGDAGTTATPARTGATSLVRTADRACLVRAPGGISLMRTILRATLAILRCHRHQEGMMTTTKMMGLGASKRRVPSLAS